VAAAQRETAAAGVPQAEERARAHVRRAQAEAREMVAAARAQVAAAADGYRAAHRAATDAGWSAAALVDMGYPQPRSTGTRPRRTRAAAPRAASVRELAPLDARPGTSGTPPDGDVDATAATAAAAGCPAGSDCCAAYFSRAANTLPRSAVTPGGDDLDAGVEDDPRSR